jgi:hypothetical protein
LERASNFDTAMSFSRLNQVLLPVLDALPQLPAVHRDALNGALGFGEGAPPSRLVVSNAALVLLRTAVSARPCSSSSTTCRGWTGASAGVLSFVARRLDGSQLASRGLGRLPDESQLPVTGRGCAPVRARRRSGRGFGEH